MQVNNNNATSFDSFEVEHIRKEIGKFIGNKNIITNIYRIQAYNSIIRGYFCVGFIDFMLNQTKIFSMTKNIKKLCYVFCVKYII